MPLDLPHLDDLTFDDLVKEAIALIPTYAPEWTNYNPSDPGITLIELFAYLTELLSYRLDRVTDNNIKSFLRLLDSSGEWGTSGDLTEDIRNTVLGLRERKRLITNRDFEELILQADDRISRILCLHDRDVSISFDKKVEGYIGIIIVPEKDQKFSDADISSLREKIEAKRLLATRISFAEPEYVYIKIYVEIVPVADVEISILIQKVKNKLCEFLKPEEKRGNSSRLPFGRNIFMSELYEIIDRLPEVVYVKTVQIICLDHSNGDLKPEKHQLVKLSDEIDNIAVKIFTA
ncbi:MAG: hypothetical protein N5P05_004264 (plasmid) [Chroococcopsis gigantea SAG 12.99]|jgi:glutaredoxin-related protein|nr:hypothetical protein [Chroococcopsis gigantea SAG 12.99]